MKLHITRHFLHASTMELLVLTLFVFIIACHSLPTSPRPNENVFQKNTNTAESTASSVEITIKAKVSPNDFSFMFGYFMNIIFLLSISTESIYPNEKFLSLRKVYITFVSFSPFQRKICGCQILSENVGGQN